MTKPSAPRIAIIGAGIIGLSCAWEFAKRGAFVTLYDKGEPGMGASWAAAGMLAPAFEAAAKKTVHAKLFDLCMGSAGLWPAFAAELEGESSRAVGYAPGPALAVAINEAQARRMFDLSAALAARGVAHEALSASEAKRLEPALTGDIMSALALPTDGRVDNRRTCVALAAACGKRGVRFVNKRAVETSETLEADAVLWATGVDERLPDVFPVKGAALALVAARFLPKTVIRFGEHYMVPHRDRMVIGATVEPGKSDLQPDREAVGQLRALAAQVCEGVESAVLDMYWAGVRPGSADDAPLLGKLEDGRWLAAGHYRNGILLAPITAKIMADMILDGETSDLAAAFSPARFEPVG